MKFRHTEDDHGEAGVSGMIQFKEISEFCVADDHGEGDYINSDWISIFIFLLNSPPLHGRLRVRVLELVVHHREPDVVVAHHAVWQGGNYLSLAAPACVHTAPIPMPQRII